VRRELLFLRDSISDNDAKVVVDTESEGSREYVSSCSWYANWNDALNFPGIEYGEQGASIDLKLVNR